MPGGANSYTISGGSTFVSPTVTSSYSVNGTNSFGCIGTSPAVGVVTVNALPTVNVATSNTLLCTGESATLTANGASGYVWNTSANTVSLVISPTVTTIYTVTGTDAIGCAKSISVTQDVSACTGIEKLANAENLIQIYPNPNNGEFTLQSDFDITLSIVNAVGQVVKTLSVNQNNGRSVSITEMANGIYFVIGQNNQGVIKQKIVVNR